MFLRAYVDWFQTLAGLLALPSARRPSQLPRRASSGRSFGAPQCGGIQLQEQRRPLTGFPLGGRSVRAENAHSLRQPHQVGGKGSDYSKCVYVFPEKLLLPPQEQGVQPKKVIRAYEFILVIPPRPFRVFCGSFCPSPLAVARHSGTPASQNLLRKNSQKVSRSNDIFGFKHRTPLPKHPPIARKGRGAAEGCSSGSSPRACGAAVLC